MRVIHLVLMVTITNWACKVIDQQIDDMLFCEQDNTRHVRTLLLQLFVLRDQS